MTRLASRHLYSFLVLIFLSLVGDPAIAQNVTGTIVGTVRDSTGAAIQSVPITVVNEGTNVEFKTQTNSDGEYIAPGLGAGVYTVKAESPK